MRESTQMEELGEGEAGGYEIIMRGRVDRRWRGRDKGAVRIREREEREGVE